MNYKKIDSIYDDFVKAEQYAMGGLRPRGTCLCKENDFLHCHTIDGPVRVRYNDFVVCHSSTGEWEVIRMNSFNELYEKIRG